MLDLSTFYHYRRAHIIDLAERRDIPAKFLGQILLQLKKNDLVESKKGPDGGYTLKRPPSEITVGEVIRIMERTFYPEKPGQNGLEKGGNHGRNGFYGLFSEIDEAICAVIDHISFEDIRKKEAEHHERNATGYTYTI